MKTPTPEIRQAFYMRLLQALPICGIEASDIAWPNTGFRPESGRAYLSPALLFSETRTITLSASGYERLSGIFQITACGLPGAGEGQLDSIARDLADIFRGGARLPLCNGWWPVTIQHAWAGQLRFDFDGARPAITVSARWQQETPKGE